MSRIPRIEKELLTNSRTIAVVGASPDPQRHSNAVMGYLIASGYRVIPINPTVESVLGRKSYPDLNSVPYKIDIVNVFRAPDKVMPTIEEAIKAGAGALWLQEGVVNEEAAARARQAGLPVVMDRCIAKVHATINRLKH
ncbi:CoA-binding protein [Dehalogenimonas sp. 4OHTPN]|uniref:CoA-binding protein n=1 Tax=Dehalogenimonas sp. 4OHTPN TaxID=3166643 RepID=A0AAU8G999_9CHLR